MIIRFPEGRIVRTPDADGTREWFNTRVRRARIGYAMFAIVCALLGWWWLCALFAFASAFTRKLLIWAYT